MNGRFNWFYFIALVSLIIIILGLKWPVVSRIIYVALFVRIFYLNWSLYHPLPDSTKDAAGLEQLAWSYGQNGFDNAISLFPGINSFFYSWSIGVLYSLFGRSILLAQSTVYFSAAQFFWLGLFRKNLG